MASREDALHTYNLYVTQGAPGATTLTNKNYAKLCKDCKIVDGIKLTNADIDITFSKHKSKGQQNITGDQFISILEELGTKRFGPGQTGKIFGLIAGKKPLSAGTTGKSATGAVDRLTDTSRYTGMHKQRFDSSGRGRGADGREDKADYSGYVSGYKNKDTYRDP